MIHFLKKEVPVYREKVIILSEFDSWEFSLLSCVNMDLLDFEFDDSLVPNRQYDVIIVTVTVNFSLL